MVVQGQSTNGDEATPFHRHDLLLCWEGEYFHYPYCGRLSTYVSNRKQVNLKLSLFRLSKAIYVVGTKCPEKEPLLLTKLLLA